MKKFFVFLLALVACQVHAGTSMSGNINIGTVEIDRNNATGNWVTVKTIDIASQNQNNGCGWACTLTQKAITTYWGNYFQPSVSWDVNLNLEQTVTTSEGNNIKVKVVGNNVVMKAGLYYYNSTNATKIMASTKTVDVTSSNSGVVSLQLSTYCGSFFSTCTYQVEAGFVSGTLEVQVQVPTVLSKKNYGLDVNLGELQAQIAVSVDSSVTKQTNSLSVSGTVTVPDRCYITIDGGSENPATQSISFNEIDASSLSGNTVLQSKTLNLMSTCIGVYGASKRVESYVKLGAASGSSFDDYILRLKPAQTTSQDSDSGNYLGIVAKNLPSASGENCNSDGNTFINGQYKDMGMVVVAGGNMGSSSLNSSYPVTFNLCTFGSGESLLTPGEHTGAIILTTRWKFE